MQISLWQFWATVLLHCLDDIDIMWYRRLLMPLEFKPVINWSSACSFDLRQESKIRHYPPQDTLLLLYHAIFAPFVANGVSVWGITYLSLLNPIFVLQKKILRVITLSDKNAPPTPIFDSLKFSSLMIWLQCILFLLYMNVFITFLLPISAIISLGLKMFIVPALDNPEEVICLLFVAIQLNMDFNLSITQVFGFGILFHLTYEIRFLSPFFVLKLNLIFYQIIAQLYKCFYMYTVCRILMNVLTCEILQTYFFSICTECIYFLYPFHFYSPLFDMLDYM